jgi:hypothetical protein
LVSVGFVLTAQGVGLDGGAYVGRCEFWVGWVSRLVYVWDTDGGSFVCVVKQGQADYLGKGGGVGSGYALEFVAHVEGGGEAHDGRESESGEGTHGKAFLGVK